MGSRISSSMSVIIISGFFVAASFAQIVTLPPDSIYAYPQYRLSPKNPTINDSVSFRIVNLHDKVCVPGQYQKAFSTVQTSSNVCVRYPCPQDYIIGLSYEPYVPHCAVIDTVPTQVKTEYGPLFSLGKLAVGDYTLVDSTDSNRVLMKFTVYENRPVHAISGPVALEKIGLPVASRVISWSRASKTISLNIPSPQTVSVSAFMINGRKTLARKRFLPAGISRIRLDNAALGRGAIIFKVEGANFSETATINLQ